RQVARLALARAVPSFHGKNAEAVADAYSVHLKRSRERRSWRLRALIVKRDVDVVAPEMVAQRLRRFERGESRIAHEACDASTASSRSRMSSSSATSDSGRRG